MGTTGTVAGIGNPWLWGGFAAFVLSMLALEPGVFHRRVHEVKPREALAWSAVWMVLALAFGGLIWAFFGPTRAQEYLAGWLIEKSLSVDNLFLFIIIFDAFRIPALHQHKVLFLGILSALVLRAVMITGGAALLERFSWLAYAFGGFLLVTGVRLWFHRMDAPDLGGGAVVRWVRRVIPSTAHFSGARFFMRENGRILATPLLLALVAVEFSDIAFAVDSVPAIFGVTSDPFIVFTSNVFAILGLRSLYFVLAGLVGRFAYLKAGLALVLVFIGVKMCIAAWVHIPAAVSLAVVVLILTGAVGCSLLKARGAAKAATPLREGRPSEPPSGQRRGRVARLAAGWGLLAAGAALLVLPGPGIPLLLGGLAILAREQPWARRAQRKLRVRFARGLRRVRWTNV
jgi:TerC family integral membrane protein